MKKKLNIRPYARLLTMLGEQLIKNEQIALAELIKNAYDADADWVKVCFVDFGFDKEKNDIYAQKDSKIIVEDNGSGMDLKTIEDSWMNPATPNKRTDDGEKPLITPIKKRIIQGEKGIGRFAILKLGRKIEITTRPDKSSVEYLIDYDLSQYDDDFLTKKGKKKKLFIDNLKIPVSDREPQVITNREVVVNSKCFKNENHHGTRIEISNLKGEWSLSMIKEVNDESQKLESIFEQISNRDSQQKIEIGFVLNGKKLAYSNDTVNLLASLMQNSSVLRITNGHYYETKSLFSYKLNGVSYKLYLSDSQMSGLRLFRDQFVIGEDLFGKTELRKSTCGDFDFNFFVFDFAADKEGPFYLDKKEKEIIRAHRIYLYRDKIRVAPYGDADDDWLEIDKRRGVGRAGDYLSNDQVVGFVDISKQGNPKLKDKTNREGLIEKGNSTKDFKILLHCFLLFIRQHPYKQYQERINQQKEQKMKELRVVASKFDELKNYVSGNTQAMAVYNDLYESGGAKSR